MACKVLTSQQIKEIEASSLPHRVLAKMFNVSPTTIWYVKPKRTAREPRSEIQRFMECVQPSSEHWLWVGGSLSRGYGRFRRDDGVMVYAHRHSYELFVGPIIPGKWILHKHEGIKLCVNPNCLYQGDASSNRIDYLQSGGISGGQKLTPTAVRDIRSSDLTVTELARKYNADEATVYCARVGQTWKFVR
jgi:DNA-binding transcriptional regulator YiaG